MPRWMRGILTNRAFILVLILAGWGYLITLGRDAVSLPPMPALPSIPQPQIAFTSVQKPDPSLMTSAAFVGMVSSIESALPGRTPVTFIFSNHPSTPWLAGSLAGMLTLVCQGAQSHRELGCSVSDDMLLSKQTHQGITVHIKEPRLLSGQIATKDQLDQTLSYRLPAVLKQWFIVTRDGDFPSAVAEHITSINSNALNMVWIEVGPGSPWLRDDIRLRDGMSQAAIDSMDNWGRSLKDRLQYVAGELAKLPTSFSSRIPTPSEYRAILAEAFMAVSDAKYKANLNTDQTLSMIIESEDFTHQKFGEIRDMMLQYSKQIPQ